MAPFHLYITLFGHFKVQNDPPDVFSPLVPAGTSLGVKKSKKVYLKWSKCVKFSIFLRDVSDLRNEAKYLFWQKRYSKPPQTLHNATL